MFGFPWNFTSQRLFTFTQAAIVADESYSRKRHAVIADVVVVENKLWPSVTYEKAGCHGVITLSFKIVYKLYIGFQSSRSQYYYQWRIWNQNSFECTSPNRSCWFRSDTIWNVCTRMLTLYVCDTHKKTWKKNAVPVCAHCIHWIGAAWWGTMGTTFNTFSPRTFLFHSFVLVFACR